MAALQYVEYPGYAALLLRRTYADLSKPGALMDRAGEWLRPTAARWNELKKTWRFPSGSTLTFGYLEHSKDKYNYQGPEFQYVGWDELSQFEEESYRYLFSRLRRIKGSKVPIRMRAATNPGSEWVKDRFPIRESEMQRVTCDPETGRVFVPALLDDNPHVDREEYIESLNELDPITRAQLLEGNWDVRAEGAMFQRGWFPLVDVAPVVGQRVRFWDLASTHAGDYTCGVKMVREGGVFTVEDVQRGRWRPAERDAVILQTAQMDGYGTRVVVEQEPGSAGVSVVDGMVTMLAGYPVEGRRSTGDKVTRAAPLASQSQAGNVRLVSGGWVGPWLDEMSAFPSKGVHDDQVDATSGAFAVLAQPPADAFLGLVAHAKSKGW